jgi:hypothetical protein
LSKTEKQIQQAQHTFWVAWGQFAQEKGLPSDLCIRQARSKDLLEPTTNESDEIFGINTLFPGSFRISTCQPIRLTGIRQLKRFNQSYLAAELEKLGK